LEKDKSEYPSDVATFFLRYIKRETAVFFGVDESSEEQQQARWLDRRKRLAVRKYGSLKEEYLSPVTSPRPRPRRQQQQQQTSAYASQVRAQQEITVLCFVPLWLFTHVSGYFPPVMYHRLVYPLLGFLFCAGG
jgi:hypothetical protein